MLAWACNKTKQSKTKQNQGKSPHLQVFEAVGACERGDDVGGEPAEAEKPEGEGGEEEDPAGPGGGNAGGALAAHGAWVQGRKRSS